MAASHGQMFGKPVLTELLVDISNYAAEHSSVIVEFKYVGSWAYWQVDVLLTMDCSLTQVV